MHAKKVCQKSTVAHRACWKTLRQVKQNDISLHFEKDHFDYDIDVLSAVLTRKNLHKPYNCVKE